MDFRESNGLIFVRLKQGEDLFKALEKACKSCSVQSAAVVSAVGMLREFSLGYFKGKGAYLEDFFPEPHELVALSGIIMQQENGEYHFHFHAALAGENHSLKGGHLGKAKVHVTNEIVLAKSNLKLLRKHEEETGLQGLYFD